MLRVDGAGTVTTATIAPDDGRPLSDLLVGAAGWFAAGDDAERELAGPDRPRRDADLRQGGAAEVRRCRPTMLTDAVTASDGTVWIAEVNCDQLLRYAPATGMWTSLSLGEDTAVLLAPDAAGGVWFAGGLVGRPCRRDRHDRAQRPADPLPACDRRRGRRPTEAPGSRRSAASSCAWRPAPRLAFVPAPVPATQLAFAPTGGRLARQPRPAAADTSGALGGPVACDDTPPATGRIRVGAETADGPVSVAALRRHRGFTISVREPAAIDALAFYPDAARPAGRYGRHRQAWRLGPLPRAGGACCARFERSLAAGRHPSFNLFATFTDLEGNPVQIPAEVRLRPRAARCSTATASTRCDAPAQGGRRPDRGPPPTASAPRPTHRGGSASRCGGADDPLELVDGVVEAVVVDDVRELVRRGELGLGAPRGAPRSDRGVSVPRPIRRVRSVSSDGGAMKMRIASGIVSRDLARALDLDLEHDRRALRGALVELGAQRAVAAAGVLGVLEEVALDDAAIELDVVEEVVVRRRAPRPGAARGWWRRRRARARARARAACGSACPCRPRKGR